MLLKTSSYSLFISNSGIISLFFIFPMFASSDSIWFSELRGAILLMAAPPAKLQSTCFTKVHRSIDCCFSSSFCLDSTPRFLFLVAEELLFLVPCNRVEKLELLFLTIRATKLIIFCFICQVLYHPFLSHRCFTALP